MTTVRTDVGGVSLAAHTAGAPDAPALVLSHGWPQSSLVYEGVIDELGVDAYVLAFDLPAIGDSRVAPPSADKTVLADLLITAAEQLGAHDIIFAGFDVGGMIAFAAARDHGERIIGSAVMNTVVPGLDPWAEVLADPRIWHFAFHAIPDLPELLVAGHEREYFDFFVDALAGDPAKITDAHRDGFAAAYARREALSAGFDWYRALPDDAERNSHPQPITTPIRYVRGGADPHPIDPYLDGLRAGGVEHVEGQVIEGSGELLPLEAPDAFVEMLRELRSSLSP